MNFFVSFSALFWFRLINLMFKHSRQLFVVKKCATCSSPTEDRVTNQLVNIVEHKHDRTYPAESVGTKNRTIKRVNDLRSSDGQKHSSKPTLTCFCFENQEQLLHGSCQIDQTPLTETVIVSSLNALHSNLTETK